MSCWIKQHLERSLDSHKEDSAKSDIIKALTFVKERYAMKLELLANAAVVEYALGL